MRICKDDIIEQSGVCRETFTRLINVCGFPHKCGYTIEEMQLFLKRVEELYSKRVGYKRYKVIRAIKEVMEKHS